MLLGAVTRKHLGANDPSPHLLLEPGRAYKIKLFYYDLNSTSLPLWELEWLDSL